MFPNRGNLARLQEELLKRTFYIYKYNTLTINDLEISLEKLLHKLEKVNRDLKNEAYETKSQDNKVKKQILYQSSNTTFRKNGVGFLENITCSSLLQDYPPSLDRLVVFGLRGKFFKIVLFHCYFLPTRHGNEEISELFDNILTTMDDTSKRYYFLLLKLTTEPIISRMHWKRCQRQPKCKRQSFTFVLKITYRSIQEKLFRTISPESRRRNQTGFIKTTITSKIF